MKALVTIIVVFIMVIFMGTAALGENVQQEVVGSFIKPFTISDTDKEGKSVAKYLVQLEKSFLVGVENGKNKYKITMQIENQSADKVTLKIGPSWLIDDTGKKHKGLFWVGAVQVFNGPFGPQEMFLSGEERESASVDINPKEGSGKIYIHARVPEAHTPSIFECYVGGKRSFVVRAKYDEEETKPETKRKEE